MTILKFQMDEVCVLPKWFISSSKGCWFLSLYIFLLNFIKIGHGLFEIIWVKTHTHTDTSTRMENNTCPKTMYLGQVKIHNHIHKDKKIPVQEQRFLAIKWIYQNDTRFSFFNIFTQNVGFNLTFEYLFVVVSEIKLRGWDTKRTWSK